MRCGRRSVLVCNAKAPVVNRGFREKDWTPPASPMIDVPAVLSSRKARSRVTAEGEGVEPLWLTKPLDRFAGGVQYPLATPSKRCLCD